MEGIKIEGITKFLAFAAEGKLATFGKEIAAYKKCAAQQKGMRVKIYSLAEGAACVILCFKGSMKAFDDITSELDKLRSRVAIDTVPLPESVAIGTWPTPEKKVSELAWVLRVSRQIQTYRMPTRQR
jgi:hypothetical protein